jgi:hypothetical protein
VCNRCMVCVTGAMKVYVGGQQPNQKTNVGSNVLVASFTVVAAQSEAEF